MRYSSTCIHMRRQEIRSHSSGSIGLLNGRWLHPGGSDALRTEGDKVDMGYEVEGGRLCKLCRKRKDAKRHRLTQCDASVVVETRERSAPPAGTGDVYAPSPHPDACSDTWHKEASTQS